MASLTQSFLRYLDSLRETRLPDIAYHAARLRLLDTLGCTLAGARIERDRMLALMHANGSTTGPSVLIGLGATAAPGLAALVNGTNAHAAELDDGNRFGMVHPGAPVISAILAQAAVGGMSDDDILTGVVLGYEAAVRLAIAVQPHAKDRGLHATGVSGAVGAAIGVAAALRLDRARMNAALAGGATGASGLLQVVRGSSQLKPFNAGQAAQVGLAAAQMAQAGFLGPADVLDGPHGYLCLTTGGAQINTNALLKGGPGLCVDGVYLKPYASCRHCHAPVEAALRLRADYGLIPEDIVSVAVRSHRMAVYMHDHTEIMGSYSGKMSIPYCVAAALVTGKFGMDAFASEILDDTRVQALTRAVSVTIDDGLTALVPEKRPAIVEITRRSGSPVILRVDLPRGEPETALTPDEVRRKFIDLAVFAGKDEAEAGDIADAILIPDAAQGLPGIVARL